MVQRFQKTFWLLCAFLLLTQSLLPASALAYVSVRCAGAEANAPVCAQLLVPQTSPAGTFPAPMSCCRHMTRHCTLAGMAGIVPILTLSSVSALPCLVTITPLTSEQPASASTVRLWMLGTSPAHAPPIAPGVASFPLTTSMRLRLPLRNFPKLLCSLSHGLRAPPTA